MHPNSQITTVSLYPQSKPQLRLFALWYFSSLLIIWTILGHTVLGFEQPWSHVFISLFTACSMQILLEWIDAKCNTRQLRFAGGFKNFVYFLLPAVIPGLAIAMLLYTNEQVWPIIFTASLAIGSKVLFRTPTVNGSQHIFNPSNVAIVTSLFLFPSIGLASPNQSVQNVSELWKWFIPCMVLITGTVVHALFTGRLPLVLAWLVAFVLQGLIRSLVFGSFWVVPLLPMIGTAFLIFTLYMIPDPATSPLKVSSQILFGVSVAFIYGMMQVLHIPFGLFISLVTVCGIRGFSLYAHALLQKLSLKRQAGNCALPA